MFDKSDPYAEVRWNGELIGRSRVMEDATSPEWNESFVIRVAPTQQNVLSIELFDFDGSGTIGINEFTTSLLRLCR